MNGDKLSSFTILCHVVDYSDLLTCTKILVLKNENGKAIEEFQNYINRTERRVRLSKSHNRKNHMDHTLTFVFISRHSISLGSYMQLP